jgi:hypothetical protein
MAKASPANYEVMSPALLKAQEDKVPKTTATQWAARPENDEAPTEKVLSPGDRFPVPSALKSRHAADRLAALAMLILAVILVATSFRYGLSQGGRPGPGLFPGIVSVGLLLVSVAWLATGAGPEVTPVVPPDLDASDTDRQPSGNSPSLEDVFFEEEPLDAAGLRRIGLVVLWSTVPVILLDRVGYVPTMVLYIGGLLVFLARIRPWIALPCTIVGVVLTAYGANALGVVLPDPLGVLELLGV